MANQAPIDINLRREGNIAILTMTGRENRINNIFCQKWMDALDEVEKWEDVKALVTTGTGKFYSNGLDLAFLGSLSQQDGKKFWQNFLALRKRILFFPTVTVAAINGHCFAGGMLLSLLHDYRVQQKNRGWMCMNEIDLGLPFTASLLAIMECKFTPKMMREVTLFGKRFNAAASLELGLIDKISEEGKAVETAIDYARTLTAGRTYTRKSLSDMKEDLYGHIIFDDSDAWINARSSKL